VLPRPGALLRLEVGGLRLAARSGVEEHVIQGRPSLEVGLDDQSGVIGGDMTRAVTRGDTSIVHASSYF